MESRSQNLEFRNNTHPENFHSCSFEFFFVYKCRVRMEM